MIKALLLPLFLQATYGAQDYQRSILVDADHKHKWVFLAEESGLPIWWDTNSIRSQTLDDKEYPTIVLRVVANEGTAWRTMFHYQDSLVAIDCANFRSATIDEVSNGQRVPDPWAEYREPPQFGPLTSQMTDETADMMRAVCGKEWTHQEVSE
jgi:hypothetical protein